jgi:hypothetical protein
MGPEPYSFIRPYLIMLCSKVVSMSLSLPSFYNICECGLSQPEWSLLLVSIHPNDMFLSPRVEVTESPSPFNY